MVVAPISVKWWRQLTLGGEMAGDDHNARTHASIIWYSTSHLTVREPPAAPYCDGAVLVCKRCASDSSCRYMFTKCCPTRIACRPAQRRHGKEQLDARSRT